MSKTSQLDSLKSKEAELERQLAELRRQRMALENESRTRTNEMGRPLRALVLELLEETAFPLNSLLLSSILKPLYGRIVPSTRFGTLSNDEAKSFDSSRARPVYLCHGLTHDSGQAVKRFWARSDWPLADRMIAPMSGRVLHLRGAAWTIALARSVQAKERTADNAEVLNFVAADQARAAGLPVTHGKFPYAEWLKAIEETIERYVAADLSAREASAQSLAAKLTPREQLFGSRKGLVSLPGSSAQWRSAIE